MPPINLAALTPESAATLVQYPADRLAILKTNRAFYTGDHWQDGRAWAGPWPFVPEGATPAQSRAVQLMHTEIKRGLVTVNALKECIEREATGTVGIEPRWSFGPDGVAEPDPSTSADPAQQSQQTPEQRAASQQQAARRDALKAKADQANTLATGWWDRVGAHEKLVTFATHLLYGATPDAEASLRLYIPAAMLDDETTSTGERRKVLRVSGIEDALQKIHLEVLDPDQGRVITDPETLAEIGIKPTTRETAASGRESVAELTYLDPATAQQPTASRRTILETIRATGRPSIALDLGGRLTMLTVSRAAFVSEQMRQSQKALNFAASVIRRNNETAGFLQDTILNAHIPGHYEGEGDKRRYIADPIERGPLALNAFRGHEIKDDNGQTTGFTTPAIDHRQPVDPTPAIKSKAEHYADILGEASQRHVLMIADATASGTSREQARAEHLKSLRRTQAPMERAGRWLLETVIAFAGALANGGNRTDLLDGLRATFSCYLDAGPLSAPDRAQNVAELQAGALSLTTLVERNGTVDVDAELNRIRAEQTDALDAELKRAQVYAAWTAAGVGEHAAAKRAGLSDAEARALVTSQTDIPPSAVPAVPVVPAVPAVPAKPAVPGQPKVAA